MAISLSRRPAATSSITSMSRAVSVEWVNGPRFYSSNISGVQRLPNGNTLVTEGANGRLFEVASDRKIVWEYMYPLFGGAQLSNAVYRGYRVPYDWIPRLP